MSLKGKCLMLLGSPLARLLPDSLYIRLKFRAKMGVWPDLKNPRGFNEKLQWLKLNDRNPLYHSLADKADVKKQVEALIGSEYVVKTLGLWNSVADIDWEALPDSFVIKCTHDSGSTAVCKNKRQFDRESVCKKLQEGMRRNFYYFDREWAYKSIKPRIIAEEYLGDNVPDYKFFCFDGKPRIMFMASDRGVEGVETKFDFFDMDGKPVDMRNGHPNSSVCPALPESFARMRELAASLSKGIPQVRIDFYDVDGHVYFGEYTFYHWGGMVPFDPPSADEMMGNMINLPKA